MAQRNCAIYASVISHLACPIASSLQPPSRSQRLSAWLKASSGAVSGGYLHAGFSIPFLLFCVFLCAWFKLQDYQSSSKCVRKKMPGQLGSSSGRFRAKEAPHLAVAKLGTPGTVEGNQQRSIASDVIWAPFKPDALSSKDSDEKLCWGLTLVSAMSAPWLPLKPDSVI